MKTQPLNLDENSTHYLTVVSVDKDKNVKVKLAKKLRGVNQYKKTWARVRGRTVSRLLNKGHFVIK